MEDLKQQKAELLRQIRLRRRKFDSQYVIEKGQAMAEKVRGLCEYRQAETVFCFASCKGEPYTHGLIKAAIAEGKRICVPKCREEGMMDIVRIVSFDDLKPAYMGILEPVEGEVISPEHVDFAILPAVACGLDGSRLGQGGGYYDRFLEKYRGGHCVLCYELFLMPELPKEGHDKKMQCIVTENRVIHI